jgi:hypothetical protein
MEWSCHGKIDGITNLDYLGSRLNDENQNKIYLITYVVNELDPKKNILRKSNLEFFPTLFSNYIEGNNIICVLRNEIKKNKYFAIVPKNYLKKGKILSNSKLIIHSQEDSKIIFNLSLIFFIVIISTILFRKKIVYTLKPFKGVIYNQQKEQFLYKNKPITVFDEQEKRLLIYLMEQKNQYVSLNNLNQLFENNNYPETISATVKRREQAVSRLIAKVSKITGIDEEELILEQKNSEDKRIKDLKILPNLLKSV